MTFCNSFLRTTCKQKKPDPVLQQVNTKVAVCKSWLQHRLSWKMQGLCCFFSHSLTMVKMYIVQYLTTKKMDNNTNTQGDQKKL